MTIIVADTTCVIPLELAAQLDIPIIPQFVIFGEKTYRDDIELTTAEFLQKLRASSELPKTAAPPPSLYHPIFEIAAKKGETVIVLAPSAKISGTVRSVETARQDFPNADIRIIDTQTVAGCLGTLVLMAHEMAQKGMSANDIEAAILEMIPHSRTYFLVDTLEYLQKGGRIGAARAILGELLQVKPILHLKDGQAAPFAQERTKKRAVGRLIEITCEESVTRPDSHLCVMHIDAEEEAQAICTELKTRLGMMNIPIFLLPAAIVVHAGPKALAVGFFA